jgi:hypothetical protein
VILFYVIHRLLAPHLLVQPATIISFQSPSLFTVTAQPAHLFLLTPSYQLTFLLPSNSLLPAHLSPSFQLPPPFQEVQMHCAAQRNHNICESRLHFLSITVLKYEQVDYADACHRLHNDASLKALEAKKQAWIHSG